MSESPLELPEAVREKYQNAFARLICMMAGIEPVDSIDGSQNWWLFQKEAKTAMDSILPSMTKRNFFSVYHDERFMGTQENNASQK